MHCRTSIPLFAVVVSLLLMMGCGGGGGGDGGIPTALDYRLLGTWYPVTATEGGEVLAMADALEWDARVTNASFHFQSDGTCVYDKFDSKGMRVERQVGRWSAQASELYLALPEGFDELGYGLERETLIIYDVGETYFRNTRWIKHEMPTQHDPYLVETWTIHDIYVDGVKVNKHDFLGMGPDSTDVVMEILPDGTMHIEEQDDGFVVDEDDAVWATEGGVFLLDDCDILLGNGFGIWDQGWLQIHGFDPTTGQQIHIDCRIW